MSRRRRWGAVLLGWVLPDSVAREVAGDLEEELARRGSRTRAHLAYAGSVFSVIAHFVLRGRAHVGWGRELRLAARRLWRAPTFSVVATTAIALGIAVNVLMLAVAETVLFAPLPYPAGDRLAVLTNDHSGSSTGGFGVAYENIRDVQERAGSVESIALYLDWQDVSVRSDERVVQLPAAFVSSDYERMLGLGTSIGRFFTDAETREGAPGTVAVLGQGTWRSVFGGDPDVVGRTVVLNGMPYEVIGVVADDRGDLRYLWGQNPVGIYLPLFAVEPLVGFDLRADRGERYLNGLVRIGEGRSFDDVRAELTAISRELARDFPRTNEGWTYHLQELDEALFERLRTPTAAVLGISVLVFLLVLVNLLTLFLLRASRRAPEAALLEALGAGRTRLAAQRLTESVLLAGAGWAAGILVGTWALGLFRASGAVRLPEFATLALDTRVLLTSVGATLVLALVMGGAPVVARIGRAEPDSLRGGGRGSPTRSGTRLQGMLVSAEVAVAFVLLVGAGLLLYSFQTLRTTGYGFDTDHLLLAQVDVRSLELESDGLLRFAEDLVAGAEGLNGAGDAFIWSPNRLGHGNQVDLLTSEGRWETNPEERLEASQHSVHPGTLARLGIRVLAGRDVSASDDPGSPRVALVSESLGRAVWPSLDPIGRRLETIVDGETVQIEVVGVTSDARHRTRLIEPFEAQRDVYYPFAQSATGLLTVAVRHDPDARVSDLADGVRAVVRELNPAVPVYGVTTMEERMREEEGAARTGALLVGLYAVLAAALAALGLYGVLAYGVRSRRREIGIRMALGADRGSVVLRVVRVGMVMTGAGLLVGLAVAVPAGRLLSGALYGIEPDAPLVLGSVVVSLTLVALVACAVPAERATRVAPSDVLRSD